jgi:hypothetical protein
LEQALPLFCQAPAALQPWGCCPLQCVCPGAHTPWHEPEMHVVFVQADGAPHAPDELQVSTPLPEQSV